MGASEPPASPPEWPNAVTYVGITFRSRAWMCATIACLIVLVAMTVWDAVSFFRDGGPGDLVRYYRERPLLLVALAGAGVLAFLIAVAVRRFRRAGEGR